MTVIHDLHVDLLVAIFAHVGVRDLCTIEQGVLKQYVFLSSLLF